MILDFQNGTPFGSNLSNIDVFYNLGVRVVQLTYNLRNLIGDGCTERYKSGLTYFGKEVVAKMNEKKMIIDVSHCSEQVGWDCIDISTAPIMITHSTSNALAKHDRAKNDDLIKIINDEIKQTKIKLSTESVNLLIERSSGDNPNHCSGLLLFIYRDRYLFFILVLYRS